MAKTAIENKQNLIIEGCYIPFDWQKDFSDEYLQEIRYACLIMTENYIENHFFDILRFGNALEHRTVGDVSKPELISATGAICKCAKNIN